MEDSERKSRLALARALRASADHSSEQALRDALSRSYYAVFHVGCALIGKGFGNHSEFLKDLRTALNRHCSDADGKSIVAKVEEAQRLRIEADYRFDAVEKNYQGNLERFREAAMDGLRLGREAYGALERIAGKLKERDND